MRIDGIQLREGSNISNLTVASGTSFPASPNTAELFFRTDSDVSVRGMYVYIGGAWDRIASADSLSSPTGTSFPATANAGDLFYLNSDDGAEALYAYNGTDWVTTSSPKAVEVVSDNGFAGTVDDTTTFAITLTTTVTGILKGDGTAISAASSGDFPTLNQSTTGSAATLTTTRNIAATGDAAWNVNFNGSANATAALTLATVNSSPQTDVLRKVTINGKGLVTASSTVSTSDLTAIIGINDLLPSQAGSTSKFLQTDGTNTSWAVPTGTPGGSDTYIQYNDSGVFGGSANLAINKTTGVVSFLAIPTVNGVAIDTNTAVTNDTTTNATVYPTWVTTTTGNLPIKVSSTKLSFNPSTGLLSTTALNTGSGSASVPAYAFTSSTGTGLWNPTTNILAISTAGTERLRISATGRIGHGASAGTNVNLDLRTTIDVAGAGQGYGIYNRSTTGFGVGTVRGIMGAVTAGTMGYTITNLNQFVAGGGAAGAGAIITNNIGFNSLLTSAGTVNVGYQSTVNAPVAGVSTSATISSLSSSGTTVTVTTSAAHNYTDGQLVTIAATADATALTSGCSVTILTVGSTDFTAIGASANTVGTSFIATGAGSGSGTVTLNVQNSGMTIASSSGSTFTYTSPLSSTFSAVTLSSGTVTVATVWNILATGTANNAMAGNLRIGSNIAPTVALDLTGDSLISGTLGVTGAITGSLTGNASTATAVGITDDTSTNATMYPTWVTSNTGNLPENVSSTKLTFNPSTGNLTSTLFSGSGASLTSIPNSALNNSSIIIGSTSTSLGGTSTALAGLTGLALTSGTVTNVPTPSSGTDAANKSYVDAAIQGLSFKQAVHVASVSNVTGTYSNGSSGVGATYTALAVGVLTIDGYSPALNERILFKNQTNAFENGIYTVTTLGTAVVVSVLTRATDADTPTELLGSYMYIENGTINADTAWANTNSGTITIGTTGVTFAQFAGAGTYSAGTGLSLTGNTFANTGVTSIIAGTNVSISGSTGVVTVNVNGTVAAAANVTIIDDTTTNATMYPTWVTTTTGNLPEKISSTKLTFNPSSGLLSTTLVQTGLGIVSAPAYSFTGNANTGMWSPTTDTLAFSTAGAEIMRIAATGEVLIGKTAATTNVPLDVLKVVDASTSCRVSNTSTGVSSTARWVAQSDIASINIQANSSTSTLSALTGGATGVGIWSPSATTGGMSIGPQAGNLRFYSQSTSAQRMAINGEIITVGSTGTSVASIESTVAYTPNFQISGDVAGRASLGINRFSNASDTPARLQFGKSRATTVGTFTVVQTDDILGSLSFAGADGSALAEAARIFAEVDGTPGTGDMPGRLVFSTSADGSGTPTERMRITSAGNVGIGITPSNGITLQVGKSLTGSTTGTQVRAGFTVNSDVTATAYGFRAQIGTSAAAFTLTDLVLFKADQGTIGAGSTVTSQYGFQVGSSLTGATNNYGFHGNIASGSNRWNFFANGSADNAFSGNTRIGGITAPTVALDVTGSANLTGSLGFTGVGPRITGDFTNTTRSSRVLFQTSTANSNTSVGAIPIGSGTSSNFIAYSLPDPTNTSVAQMSVTDTIDARFQSGITGTGTYLPMTFYTNGLEQVRIDTSGNMLMKLSGGLGYGTGSGGTVTQITSRTTGVTLSKTNGAITMFSAAGSATAATFTVTNTTVAATDVIICNQKSGTNLYNFIVTAVAAGSFNITFYTTGGTATDAPVINFAVIKAVTA